MRHRLFVDVLPPRLLVSLGVLIGIIVVGTIGYMVAGMSLLDALYQTVTTLTTVGFHELQPFGRGEKIFTIILILAGVGTALYTLTLVFAQMLEGDIRSRFYFRREKMRIESLSDHYILCGFGRVGQEIARELCERGADFVIIEQNAEMAERARAFNYLVIQGDAADERVLNRANLLSARCLLAASDSDAGNTYITLTAKSINSQCFIVARVAYPHNEQKLRLAGADRVISLYSLGGRRMVLSAMQPLAADFMDTIAAGRSGELVLAEFEANSENGLAGKTAGELVHGARNATLLGIRQPGGKLAVGPRDDFVLGEGDVIILLAEEGDIASMRAPASREGAGAT